MKESDINEAACSIIYKAFKSTYESTDEEAEEVSRGMIYDGDELLYNCSCENSCNAFGQMLRHEGTLHLIDISHNLNEDDILAAIEAEVHQCVCLKINLGKSNLWDVDKISNILDKIKDAGPHSPKIYIWCCNESNQFHILQSQSREWITLCEKDLYKDD